jgi:hypothetical protein
MARKTYEIGGMTFVMRTFNGRDITRITGKLALLPTDEVGGMPPSQSNELADGLLALCSRVPKITLDEPDVIPEGTIPVSEIPDAVWQELVLRLSRDSGYGTEAAEEIRPMSAIAESS